MQAPNAPVGTYGYSVRNYAPAPLCQGPRCASSAKEPSGKSFTIEALLAKPEQTANGRASPSQCGLKYVPETPILPLTGLNLPQAPYMYSAIHSQPGYSVYCCSPFTYQASCRGGFYAPAAMSKVSAGFHPLKAKGGRSKRMRTSFTSEQLSRLEKEFARQQYMVGSERFLLASALQLTEAQVKVWFQNRRIKWRKQSLEQQQAKLAKLGLATLPNSPGSQGHGGEEEFSDSDVEVDVSDESTEQS